MKRSLRQNIRFFLTRHRQAIPLNIHAILIRHNWVENLGLTYMDSFSLNREHAVYPDEAEYFAREKAREELWKICFQFMHHRFFIERIETEIQTDFNNTEVRALGVQLHVIYRQQTPPLKEIIATLNKLLAI